MSYRLVTCQVEFHAYIEHRAGDGGPSYGTPNEKVGIFETLEDAEKAMAAHGLLKEKNWKEWYRWGSISRLLVEQKYENIEKA